ERVAGLIVNMRSLERELDVPHVLRRAARRDALIDEHLGAERILARMRARGRARRPREPQGLRCLGASVRGGDNLGGGFRDDGVHPPGRGRLEVDVALDACFETLRTERFELLVELTPGLAKALIARVAEREHREAHLRKL